MPASPSPLGSRRRLGAELRRLRLRCDLTLDEVAVRMTCSTSKISRLETGKGVPKIPDVRELMRIYGVTSDTEQDMLLRLVHDGRQHGWWEELVDGVQPERYVLDAPGRFPALESDATAVCSFHVSVLPGLFQTPDYARAVISRYMPHHSAEEVERLVAMRERRQRALRRSEPPPLALDVVLDESALRRVVGGPELTALQLRRLLGYAELSHVEIRVLPFEAGVLRAHAGSFVILRIPADLGSDVVYIEGNTGESYLDAPADVRLYEDVFADVRSRALDPDDSLALIGKLLDEPAPQL